MHEYVHRPTFTDTNNSIINFYENLFFINFWMHKSVPAKKESFILHTLNRFKLSPVSSLNMHFYFS